MNHKIRPIGDVLKTDKSGFLINNSKKIKGKWKKAVDKVIDSYIEGIPKEKIHSIWIRGSVAKGNQIDYISDIDSFALTKGNFERKEFNPKNHEKSITSEYPFIKGVEFLTIPYREIISEENLNWWRFTLKTGSICVYGKDISEKIKKFKPDKNLAKKLICNLEKEIIHTKEKIKTKNINKIKEWCTWIMKRILRQGMILTMKSEKTYTRDLYPCYTLFSKNYQAKKEEMWEVLNLAINPVSDKEKINSVLDNIGRFVVVESRKI